MSITTTVPPLTTKPKQARKPRTSKATAGRRSKRAAPACKKEASLPAAAFLSPSKNDHILTLLAQPDGASIPELMEATGWQQHSLRGFFSGTVKKKLGLELTSAKADGEDRRYRIVADAAN